MAHTESIPSLNEFDLKSWGLNEVAYVRRAMMDGVNGFAICAADGRVIGFSPNKTKAEAAIVQNDLEVLVLH